jgi:hypothetical protein
MNTDQVTLREAKAKAGGHQATDLSKIRESVVLIGKLTKNVGDGN